MCGMYYVRVWGVLVRMLMDMCVDMYCVRVCKGVWVHCVMWCVLNYADDLDLELRLERYETLMDRRPLLLSRWVWPVLSCACLWAIVCVKMASSDSTS